MQTHCCDAIKKQAAEVDRSREGRSVSDSARWVGGQSRGWQIRLDVHQSLRNSPAASTVSIIPPRICSFDTVRSLSWRNSIASDPIDLPDESCALLPTPRPVGRTDNPLPPRPSDVLSRKKSRSTRPRPLPYNLVSFIRVTHRAQCRPIYIPSLGQRAPSSPARSSPRSWWSACHTSSPAQPHDAHSPIQR
jgi:hypothetical protein